MSATSLLNDRDVSFLLYELLDTEKLLKRTRYQEHSLEIFNATLETAKAIAHKYFANHNVKGDANEPTFDGERIHMIEETQQAWDAFAEAGFLSAHYDFADGGMQMPEIVLRMAMSYITAANVASSAYPFLTIGAANLIHTYASAELKDQFLPPMQSGRFAGTMALTEPGQGSALADIKTSANKQEDGSYRIFGQKMYISGGDQSLTENIVHMVLAKIKGAPAGAGGISLFLCPKILVNADGSLGESNDVQLAGLLHKMGYRNTTSTVLNFGEAEGAVGYLVGEPHQGLKYMFQMMNEARIGVGLGAAILGYQGFRYSLSYAKDRPQGRLPSNKDPESRQVNIIQHADVKRMLLAQKAYCEGGLAMCLFATSLFEDSRTAETESERKQAFLLLDLLTPIVKSWPSKYGLKANELAIQVLGGSGYIREYPVEQYYRDNRLNPIHEGTEGIQGLDLLGRKVHSAQFQGLQLFASKIKLTIKSASKHSDLIALGESINSALDLLNQVTQVLLSKMANDPDLALANANLYLDMFGRVFASWLWLKQAVVAADALQQENLPESEIEFYKGKLSAARYYIEWELPEINHQAELLQKFNPVCLNIEPNWL